MIIPIRGSIPFGPQPLFTSFAPLIGVGIICLLTYFFGRFQAAEKNGHK